jgi:hypothetical protein
MELPAAGHWIHVDNPKGLQEMMVERIAPIKDCEYEIPLE